MEHDDNEKLFGDKKMPFKELWKRTMEYVKPEWKGFLLSFVLMILSVVLDSVSPMLISYVARILQDDPSNYGSVILMVCLYLADRIICQAIWYVQAILLQRIGQDIVYKLRMDVFTHIENMSQNQLNTMPVGSLVTRVASYTASLSDLFTNILINVLKNVLTLIAVFIITLVLAVKYNALPLLGIFVGVALIVFFSSLWFSNIVGKLFRKERKYVSDLNTFLNENLSGMKVIQVFNQQERKDEEFCVKNEELRKVRFDVTKAFGIYRPFISLLYILSEAAIFLFAIICAIPVDGILNFYDYLGRFFNPVQNLADQLNGIQQSFTSSERLFNLMDVAPEVLDLPTAREIEHFEGKIEFRNVWFAYNKEEWILKDVSFVIEPRQTVAFVGATGAGKTTILSLIVRNYEIQKGQILIDDIDIKDIKIESLRKAIGQMLQDVFIFSGTIKSNITLKDDEITDEEVLETCKYVNADHFISKLDNGIYQEVIERGENFSQGERQLLSFARTVVHKPQIMILDEATANIDTETEVVIQDSLEKIKNIGTMLVVAHRLSTIQHSDQIMVLQHGEIVEHGTHQELLKNKGYYFNLYKLQFEDQEK